MTDQDLINQLQHLTNGLTWISETDASFEVIEWEINADSLDAQALIDHLELADTLVETQSLESFFKPAVIEQDWYREREKAEVRRYQALVNWLRDNLDDIRVYRVGTVEVDIYCLGKTTNGNLAGVKTQVVET